MATPFPGTVWTITDDSGNPISGAKIHTYSAGTLTDKAVYTTSALSVATSNPIIANPDGTARFYFGSGAYRIRVFDANDVELPKYAEDNMTDPAGLTIDLAGSGGADMVGLTRTFTGAVATTLQDWHDKQIIDLAADLSADTTGATDCTALFQSAITAGSVKFTAGSYTMSGDVSIPGNRKIIVEKGATITNTGGRFTAEDVDNVEWLIDGWVKSVSMATAASKPLWTATAGERGFIEFADIYTSGQAASGFKVHGTGRVSGDWTGTPNDTDYAAIQNNRKGIACWNAKNVLVSELEIFGFHGEAVYASFFDAASHNIVFENNNVHDTRHNALNFNNGANGGGCAIRNNRAVTCLQIEIANGECNNNYISGTTAYGIFQGAGQGGSAAPLIVRGNTIVSAGTSAIAAINSSGFSSPRLVIEDNLIVNAGQYSVFVNYANEVSVRGNSCTGSATLAGAYDIALTNVLRGAVAENLMFSPGAFSVGQVAVDWTNCSDVSLCPDSNIYMATTGAAKAAGNPVATVASAAAVTLPSLGKVFSISGTTNITSVVATGNNGREVTLIFQSTPTFTDGSNLKLAGNLVATADDTITIVCDGTNWFEVCRSVN